MTDWFARPVLQVKDVDASLPFYVNLLGFTSPSRYDEEGALILANMLSPDISSDTLYVNAPL